MEQEAAIAQCANQAEPPGPGIAPFSKGSYLTERKGNFLKRLFKRRKNNNIYARFNGHRVSAYAHGFMVKPPEKPPKEDENTGKREVWWTRSIISEFSRAARRNFMRLLAMIDLRRYQPGPLFLTVTYGSEKTAGDWVGRDYKHDLKLFLQRLMYQYPDMVYLWRIETQQRGAPHFHFLLLRKDRPFTDADAKNIEKIWPELIDAEGSREGAGRYFSDYSADATFCRSWRKLAAYCAKYIAKEQPGPGSDIIHGKRWGRSEEISLDKVRKTHVVKEISLTIDEVTLLRKICHKLLRSKQQNEHTGEWWKKPAVKNRSCANAFLSYTTAAWMFSDVPKESEARPLVETDRRIYGLDLIRTILIFISDFGSPPVYAERDGRKLRIPAISPKLP